MEEKDKKQTAENLQEGQREAEDFNLDVELQNAIAEEQASGAI